MLTIDKEDEIRRRINEEPGASNRSIGKAACVTRGAVQRVRGTKLAIERLGSEKSWGIRKLILKGLSKEAIVAAAGVSSSDVTEVKLFYYLLRRKSGNPIEECPTCGSMMFSEELTAENKVNKETGRTLPPEISEEQAAALYRVVVDMYELDRLCIVTNPAFHYLARRAESTLKEIHGNEK